MISGHEEARLIFGAVRASVVLDPAPALCFDLGGGSLEVMVGDTRGMQWATSVPLGVARLTTELVHSDPVSKRDRRALRERIDEELTPGPRRGRRGTRPRMAVGSSGTLEALAHMTAARRDEDVPSTLNQLTITRDEFLVVHKEILGSTADERLRFAGLDARRVDLVVAGSMLLATAMELFDLDSLTISEWALREGIVLDAVGRHDPADWSDDPRAIRRESVIGLARALQLARSRTPAPSRGLALELFDATAELHDPALGAADRELLELAALAARHRRARAEQRPPPPRRLPRTQRPAARLRAATRSRCSRRSCAGTAAASHRVSDEFPLLDADAIARVRALAAILRVADGLDRSREGIVARDRRDGHAVARAVRPRTAPADDAELEVWGARRKRMLLERVLDREVEFTSHPAGRARHEPCPDLRCRRAGIGRRLRHWSREQRREQDADADAGMTAELVVRSPYDGHEVGRVPACGAAEVGRAVAAARDALAASPPGLAPGRDPRPRRPPARRARRRSSRASSPRRRPSPSSTARVEARRAVSTFTFAAAEARTLARRDGARWTRRRPARASSRSCCASPIGVVGAISPFNFPLNLVAHKVAPADRRRLPGGAQARVADAAVGDRAGRAPRRRVRPARRAPHRRHRQRCRTSATRWSTTPTSR